MFLHVAYTFAVHMQAIYMQITCMPHECYKQGDCSAVKSFVTCITYITYTIQVEGPELCIRDITIDATFPSTTRPFSVVVHTPFYMRGIHHQLQIPTKAMHVVTKVHPWCSENLSTIRALKMNLYKLIVNRCTCNQSLLSF